MYSPFLTNRDSTPDVHGVLASLFGCSCAPLRHRRRRHPYRSSLLRTSCDPVEYFYLFILFWSHIRLTTDSICYTNRILWTFCISMDTRFVTWACRGLEDNSFCNAQHSNLTQCDTWPIPVNTRHWAIAGLMLGERRRRWANISSVLAQCLVFAGILLFFCDESQIFEQFTFKKVRITVVGLYSGTMYNLYLHHYTNYVLLWYLL